MHAEWCTWLSIVYFQFDASSVFSKKSGQGHVYLHVASPLLLTNTLQARKENVLPLLLDFSCSTIHAVFFIRLLQNGRVDKKMNWRAVALLISLVSHWFMFHGHLFFSKGENLLFWFPTCCFCVLPWPHSWPLNNTLRIRDLDRIISVTYNYLQSARFPFQCFLSALYAGQWD